jgi:phosphotransferase system  glucose/maltose/N-acetylglucosamine-specific IIC component
MNKNTWPWTVAKCLSVTIGGPLLGCILALILGFIVVLATNGTIDDAPGDGLLAIGILGLGILVGSVIGFCIAAEFIQERIEDYRVFNTKRLCSRFLFGFASLIGPLWIFLFWPPTKYRVPYQSHSLVLLVYGISICFALVALRIRFSHARREAPLQ